MKQGETPKGSASLGHFRLQAARKRATSKRGFAAVNNFTETSKAPLAPAGSFFPCSAISFAAAMKCFFVRPAIFVTAFLALKLSRRSLLSTVDITIERSYFLSMADTKTVSQNGTPMVRDSIREAAKRAATRGGRHAGKGTGVVYQPLHTFDDFEAEALRGRRSGRGVRF